MTTEFVFAMQDIKQKTPLKKYLSYPSKILKTELHSKIWFEKLDKNFDLESYYTIIPVGAKVFLTRP